MTRTHQDFPILVEIKSKIFEAVGGETEFRKSVPEIIRKAIDEVIDTPRTARIAISDLEKTEKTYLGTKGENVLWLFRDNRFPQGFWYNRDPLLVGQIMDSRASGAERIRRLFRSIQRTRIPREVIEGVARQLDPLKRLRANGGTRDRMAKEGIAILCGNWDNERRAISALGLPLCGNGDFISISPNSGERKILQSFGVEFP